MAYGPITHFIWTDINPEDEKAFNAWYTAEHMPDRVLKVPGFTRGRRFGAVSGGPKYLAYYEMIDSDVMWSKEYVAIRAEPDPKSKHFVSRFRNALRATGAIAAEFDAGEGNWLAVAGIEMAGGDELAVLDAAIIADAFGPAVSRVRLSRTDHGMVNSNFKKMDTGSRGALRPKDGVPDWMLTIEGDSAEAVDRTLKHLLTRVSRGSAIAASAIMELLSEFRPNPS